MEARAHALFLEAKENVWVLERALSADVGRLVRTGDGVSPQGLRSERSTCSRCWFRRDLGGSSPAISSEVGGTSRERTAEHGRLRALRPVGVRRELAGTNGA
jgi:hypothetical protein